METFMSRMISAFVRDSQDVPCRFICTLDMGIEEEGKGASPRMAYVISVTSEHLIPFPCICTKWVAHRLSEEVKAA